MVDIYLLIAAGVGLFFLATCCWKFRKTQTVIAVATMMGQEPLPPPPVVQIRIHLQSQGTQQQGDEQPKGLDKATIDSYPRIVIGQNGEMLQHGGDNACPICLIEYQENDTIMILPECLHRFHVDCLDEWLRTNGTCPVCRLQPPALNSANVS